MPGRIEIKEGQCEACFIFIGGKEEPWWELTDYRGHKICSWCINSWMRREKLIGREITWEEFTIGKLKYAAR